MKQNQLIENMIDQIKEAQIKLGYARESVRLYYPVESLNRLMGTTARDGEEMKTFLESDPAFWDICGVFARFSESYVCEKMPEGADFDYVLYFPDGRVDGYYYCIKEEMDHTIYHRFTEADFKAL